MERAGELKASLQPELTDDEKEYLDEYKSAAVDSIVSKKERRLLENFGRCWMFQRIGQVYATRGGHFVMDGNMCEWCEDAMCDYTEEEQVNPNHHVTKGFLWTRKALSDVYKEINR